MLNRLNVGDISQKMLGFPYDSHGCFHFYPTDIYLLYHIVPDYTILDIKSYKALPPEAYIQTPLAVTRISTKEQLKTYKNMFNNPARTRIEAYPGINRDRPEWR